MRSPIYSRIKNVGYNKTSSIFIELSFLKSIKTFPGCYFLLCFYKDISKYQWHPLSLITNDNNILSFCAKDNGGNSWTNKLKNVINEYNILLNSKIYIQGPYGTDFSKYYKNNKYNNIILFCGGIGITPLISILQDLELKIKYNTLNNLKKINFIWLVNNQYLIKSFEKYFMNLSNKFIINIFITGHDLEYADDINVNFYDKLNIFYYKPSVSSLLTKKLILKENNCIISCGNPNLIKLIQTYNYTMNNFQTDLYYESFA
jgi:NAD(P)H-flavin reductase